MAQFLHLFETENEFTSAYTGENYNEPWVSYTEETEKVDYNHKNYITIIDHDNFVTIIGPNETLTCEELYQLMGEPAHTSWCDFGIEVFNQAGQKIFSGFTYVGDSPHPATACEKIDFYWNTNPLISGDNPVYIYDTTNEEFYEGLRGCTIRIGWKCYK